MKGREGGASRIGEASDWFARMRGPDAHASREGFEVWLADPRNARAYHEIERVWAATGLAQAPCSGVKPALAQPSWRRYALAASIIVVGIVLALLLSAYGGSAVTSRPGIAYSSRLGEIRTFTLADASRVTLDTASRIEVSYAAGERRVRLVAGRARFEVAHARERPFVVVAGTRAVVAHGTVFDVRLEGEAVEVMLLEGRVEVEQWENAAPARRIVQLLPGDRAVLHEVNAVPVVQGGWKQGASWTRGLIAADAMALGELVAEANRYSRRRISLADPALARLRVTGAFRPGDPAALAAKLAAAFDLRVAVRPDGSILITRKPV